MATTTMTAMTTQQVEQQCEALAREWLDLVRACGRLTAPIIRASEGGRGKDLKYLKTAATLIDKVAGGVYARMEECDAELARRTRK